jgi:hypothetical protein
MTNKSLLLLFLTDKTLVIIAVNISNPSGREVLVTSDIGVEIWWNNAQNVRVTILGRYRNQTEGLCGTYNDVASDDYKAPNGSILTDAVDFGNSWSVDPDCEDAEFVPHPCVENSTRALRAQANCSALLSNPFSACTSNIDATEEGYIKDCEYDVCACERDPDACLCQAIDAYVADCKSDNVTIEWLTLPQYSAICSKSEIRPIYDQSISRSINLSISLELVLHLLPNNHLPIK